MKDQLCIEYPKRLKSMFMEVNKHFSEKAFGGKKILIGHTLPFMILEKWRERGHADDIPLLDEAVKNVVLATALSIFGWEKTSCLHLRVALENVLYGVFLLGNKSTMVKYRNSGILIYRRFSTLIGDFENISKPARKISKLLSLHATAITLYDTLSKWSHTLGDDFVSDLSILGYQKTDNSTLGTLKDHYVRLCRIACAAYLTAKPDIFTDISPTEQRMFLQPFTIDERKKFRGYLGI
jgi:hypothetical protein